MLKSFHKFKKLLSQNFKSCSKILEFERREIISGIRTEPNKEHPGFDGGLFWCSSTNYELQILILKLHSISSISYFSKFHKSPPP